MKALGATAIHILEKRQRCCLGQESSSLAPPMLMVLLLQCLQRFPPGFRIDPQTPSLHLHLLPRWLSFISSNTTCSSCPQDLCTCCAHCVKYSPLTSLGSNLHSLCHSAFTCSERPLHLTSIRPHRPTELPPHLLCCGFTIHLNISRQNYFLLFF